MTRRRENRGASTIAAIMMIIILGILGSAFLTLLNTEQYGYLNKYEADQSFYNAAAGVEWGMKQGISTPAPISFAGGTISVSVAGNSLTSTGTTDRGERVIQVTLPAGGGPTPPTEGCESFTVSTDSGYSSYETAFTNPSGGTGDTLYVKVKTTRVVGCSGGTPTIDRAEIYLENLQCPNDNATYDTVSDWSCTGPTTGGGCTDYYEYTIGVVLPSGWSDTSAKMRIWLKKGGNNLYGYEVITIGAGDCSSVKFYSDSGYTTEVDPWELEKGQTYYLRIITDNLNGAAPNEKKLQMYDFTNYRIFDSPNFFAINGTQDITCGGSTYTYASYEGNFTVPLGAPVGGSDWDGEPTTDYYYNFKILLSNGGGCNYYYDNTFKIIDVGTIQSEPLDEAASEATATQSNSPSGGDWHGAQGGNKKFIIKLFNETDKNINMTGFEMSCSTSQPNYKEVHARTAANGWTKRRLHQGEQSLPTGVINFTEGGMDDRTIPANSFIVMDGFTFAANLNSGTFTLTIYFEGGVSSTLTFTL